LSVIYKFSVCWWEQSAPFQFTDNGRSFSETHSLATSQGLTNGQRWKKSQIGTPEIQDSRKEVTKILQIMTAGSLIFATMVSWVPVKGDVHNNRGRGRSALLVRLRKNAAVKGVVKQVPLQMDNRLSDNCNTRI